AALSRGEPPAATLRPAAARAALASTAQTAAPAGEMRPPSRPSPATVALDEKAALRSLFNAAATPTGAARRAEVPTARSRVQPLAAGALAGAPDARVRSSFSSAQLDNLPADSFRGPAVVPLPTLR
ncbi:MAG: hypothetical protein JWR86_3009, partial [Enterovirga sp.]|nr:hypothetical protein [Enterovirga sp.]